jgi:hypothetical protein
MEITPTWKHHPLAIAGKVEELPIEFVWQYWGSDVSPHIEYDDGTGSFLPGLWERILDEGLEDPLIIRVGLLSKTMRLEAGNHRIQVLREHGVAKVPVTVEIREYCGPGAPDSHTDATKVFPLPPEGILVTSLQDTYLAPSKVFKSL